jgi:hypothetical protein
MGGVLVVSVIMCPLFFRFYVRSVTNFHHFAIGAQITCLMLNYMLSSLILNKFGGGMRRRKFMKIIGGSTALLAGGTYLWAAPTAKSTRATWNNVGQYTDPMRTALSYAVLAPNPHNRQPWSVELMSGTEAVLYCDEDRHLPVTDPLDRQITIGLGCFLELFDMAAGNNGYRADIDLFPLGSHPKRLDARPVARLSLTPAKQKPDPLFAQITNRRTDRSKFSERMPSSQNLTALQEVAGKLSGASVEADLVNQLRNICAAAARIEFTTPYTHAESVGLMRVGRQAVKANPDGISIEGPMIEILNVGGAMSKKALADHDSTAFKQGMKMYLGGIDSAKGFFWVVTPDNSRANQIAAGRAYARSNLKAAALGLSIHPLSQALQEYPEMMEQLSSVHKALDIDAPARLQMLARIGYGKAYVQSPRWSLESRIRS